MEDVWSKMYSQGRKKYQLVNVIARRARQLNEGERPGVPAEGLDPIRAAVEELKADKIRVKIGAEIEEKPAPAEPEA